MISTALLDLDGTLTDPIEGISHALDRAAQAVGVGPLTQAQHRAGIGPPLADVLADLGVPQDRVEEGIHAYRAFYGETGYLENRLYDGVLDALAALRDVGVRLVLATSKPEPYARRIVEHFGVAPYLEHVAGATLDGTVATKADVIARALSAVDVAAGPGVVMVGDRAHDVRGAAEHGIACVGAAWGYGEPGELLDAGAVALADSPADLVDVLRALGDGSR
ncbi:HAD hydrolase-like protein [Isoptericola sp. b441]|uniref:HAD hydrolase-like protein n=1 Tax=Actinotalea lenta TaxID=3064654 RepID=A0ABT9D784_9CELL|nr:HAD hydrolase-like protein [Isoptericola sp. b441]MDO8106405.1 HAD hydrolase-like protein [Isoptericola sp. b441]